MELKPCPFCGCLLERRERKTYGGRTEVAYIHPENNCIILKWKIETPADVEMWNRRVSEAVYLPEKFSKNAKLLDVRMKAADAIEDLTAQLDQAVEYLRDNANALEELNYKYQKALSDLAKQAAPTEEG